MKRLFAISRWIGFIAVAILLVPMAAITLDMISVVPGGIIGQAYADSTLKNEALRIKLEQAHRILYMQGLAEDSTRGHITARSEDGLVYIKPWGMPFEKVVANDMQGIDMDGNLRDGKGKMHSERVLHLEIYRNRKDVGSVIHVHPHYSVLLSTVFNGNLSIIGQTAVPFMGKLPFYVSPDLIQTKAQATDVAQALGDRPVILMKNHGITVVGRSIEEAVVLAVHFEQTARDHLYANLFGKASGMTPEDAKKLYNNNYKPDQIKMIWDYWLEKYNEKH